VACRVSHCYAGDRPTSPSSAWWRSSSPGSTHCLVTGELTLVLDAGQGSKDNQRSRREPLHFVGRCRRRTTPSCSRASPFLQASTVTFPAFGTSRRERSCSGRVRLIVTHSQNCRLQRRGLPRPLQRHFASPRYRLASLGERPARPVALSKKRSQRSGATLVRAGSSLEPRGRRTRRATARLFRRRRCQAGPRGRAVRKARPVHRSRRVAVAKVSPLTVPIWRRGGLSPDEGPEGGLSPDVPLDRAEDPRPCATASSLSSLPASWSRGRACGITMSVRELLSSLKGIEETVLLYRASAADPCPAHTHEMDAGQQRLYDLFGLDTYARSDELGTTKQRQQLR